MSDPLEIRPVFAPVEGPAYSSHVVLSGAFSARQCDRIVAIGESLPVASAALSAEDPLDDALRRSQVAWIEPGPETLWLYDKLAVLAERVNRRYRFDITGFGEDLQYTVYDEPGAFYTWHQDGLGGDVTTRKLALVVQLSDPSDYDGANLEMFDQVADLSDEALGDAHARASQRGTVVAFPAFEYHRVTPLVSGVRRSLVVWVSGPPFR
ncbi:MAG: 2OG-Fe(II) oxygenase [Acidimicrobiales bacterium]